MPWFLQVKLYLYNLYMRYVHVHTYIFIVQHTGVWYQVLMCDVYVNHGKYRQKRTACRGQPMN